MINCTTQHIKGIDKTDYTYDNNATLITRNEFNMKKALDKSLTTIGEIQRFERKKRKEFVDVDKDEHIISSAYLSLCVVDLWIQKASLSVLFLVTS